jgi:hypothetical protein
MSLDSDVALIGTGLAPLVAASILLAEGKSVLLLNPDYDFFREDSELPLDPLWPFNSNFISVQRLKRNSPEQVLNELRPNFPGAVEVWPSDKKTSGFRDPMAPYTRVRQRLWLQNASGPSRMEQARAWEFLESLYVEGSDAGLNPQIVEGISALKKFPGFIGTGAEADSVKGLLLPKLCDVDVSRYRGGYLEFVQERLESEKIFNEVSQIHFVPKGLRFHALGASHSAYIHEGVYVFWTPQLSNWVLTQAKESEAKPILPQGLRLWEQWSLTPVGSAAPAPILDPTSVGGMNDLLAWTEVEGAPGETNPGKRLSLLRAGPLIDSRVLQPGMGGSSLSGAEASWASSGSFTALWDLCREFLKWEKFSVSSMRPRMVFEWPEDNPKGFNWQIPGRGVKATVVGGCDGPIFDVVRRTRAALGVSHPEKEGGA